MPDAALAHTTVQHEGARPERTALFVHGILGSKRNWISFARRFCAERPDFRVVCADLRHHGESPKPLPPHTVEACARDLSSLRAVINAEPEVVLGHSFGGKVVLHYARDFADELAHLFVVDTPPGKTRALLGSDEIKTVLDAIESAPVPFGDRDAVIAHFVACGLPESIGRWMTTNVVREGSGLVFRFSFDAVKALLTDYGTRDYWPVLQSPPSGAAVHILRGARSNRYHADDIARLDEIQSERCTVDVVPGAGHWVHTDNPDALLELVLRRIPA